MELDLDSQALHSVEEDSDSQLKLKELACSEVTKLQLVVALDSQLRHHLSVEETQARVLSVIFQRKLNH